MPARPEVLATAARTLAGVRVARVRQLFRHRRRAARDRRPAPDAGVTAGSRFTRAWQRDGSTWCWGDGHTGAIGDGALVSRPTPVRVLANFPLS